MSTPSFTTPLHQLPTFTATPGAVLELVGVVDNIKAVRVSWDSMATEFVQQAQNTPTSHTSGGVFGTLRFDNNTVYARGASAWGKVVAYKHNWDDLTDTTRFLRVDTAMTLTGAERTNLRTMVGLTLATQSTTGLVKGSSTVAVAEDGTLSVAMATDATPGLVTVVGGGNQAVSYTHFQETVQNLQQNAVPVASNTVLGGILSSSTVRVAPTGTASVHVSIPDDNTPGLVRLADTDVPQNANHAPTVALTKNIATTAAQEAAKLVTNLEPGISKPFAGGAVYVRDEISGAIDVKTATGTQQGTVTVASVIPTVVPGAINVVPNLQAVKDYVASIEKAPISAADLPLATSGTRGAIIGSPTVQIRTTGGNIGQAFVPAATAATAGVVTIQSAASDSAPTTTLSLKKAQEVITDTVAAAVAELEFNNPATAADAGIVLVAKGSTDTGTGTITYTVPTLGRMKEYVDARTTVTTWNGGNVAMASAFQAGLTTPDKATPSPGDVLNYGQLQTLISGGGSPDPAPSTTTVTAGNNMSVTGTAPNYIVNWTGAEFANATNMTTGSSGATTARRQLLVNPVHIQLAFPAGNTAAATLDIIKAPAVTNQNGGTGLKFHTLTQSAYDAMPTKDSQTIYLIVG